MPSATNDVTVIIVNYNSTDFTIDCLASIYAHPPSHTTEIVVLDNASADAEAERLGAWIAARGAGTGQLATRFERSAENLGFAGGNNAVIRTTRSRHVLLLNNDTLVPAGAIDRAVAFMDATPDAGVVSGTILNDDRTLQSTHMPFPSLRREFLIYTTLGRWLIYAGYPSAPRSPAPRRVDWMSGAFLLLRRAALEQVGLMDEAYFMYGEEADLQYRLSQAGWRAYYVPDVEIIHFGGKSSTPLQRRRWIHSGTLRFYRKHYGRARRLLLRTLLIVISAAKIVAWSAARLSPAHRPASRRQLRSNLELLSLYARPDAAE